MITPDPREALREAVYNAWFTGPIHATDEQMVDYITDAALAALAQAAPPPERVRPGGYLTPPFSAAQAAPPPDYREDGGREGDWVLRHTVDPTAQAAPPPVCAFPGCGLPEHLHGSPAPEPPNPTRSTHRFQAAQPSGLDEEHCCGDLSHMSPEYIAALSPTPDAS